MVRLSKDEMNLVEYPFAALWRSQDRDVVINHEWQAQHPDTGKALKALWRVQGDSELGLPTSNDEKVYLVLLEITREAGFEQKVFFTSYDLIKRLNWPDNQQSYQMLFQAFQRLKAVTITAHNTFWNPRARAFRNVVFSILDNVDITPEKKGRRKAGEQIAPMSFFKWNDVIHDSFQNGYIRSIDLAFVLSLKGDITRRLYRYLDKKKHDGRRTFEIELPILCTRHLGMKPSPYPSKLKERLKTAHEELLAHGFCAKSPSSP
jgi:plasmid replication initiation protein